MPFSSKNSKFLLDYYPEVECPITAMFGFWAEICQKYSLKEASICYSTVDNQKCYQSVCLHLIFSCFLDKVRKRRETSLMSLRIVLASNFTLDDYNTIKDIILSAIQHAKLLLKVTKLHKNAPKYWHISKIFLWGKPPRPPM